MKWLEVNIEKTRHISMDDILIKIVKPLTGENRAKIHSWHFLWEGKPWPITLRLRFLGDDREIKDLRQYLEERLKDIPHCYGRHGDCGEGKEYEGEADSWGTAAWVRGIEFLEFGSDFAIELIQNKEKLGKSKEYKYDIFSYADRYTHLFLNQISSLLDEADFDLREGAFRFALQAVKKQKPSLPDDRVSKAIAPIVRSAVQEIKQRIEKEVSQLK